MTVIFLLSDWIKLYTKIWVFTQQPATQQVLVLFLSASDDDNKHLFADASKEK